MLPQVERPEVRMLVSKPVLAVLAAWSLTAGATFAQAQVPITARDVVGDWTLSITPADRPGLNVSVESADGGRPDLPLTITAQANGRLACVVNDRPAQCRIADGDLIVVSPSSSGSARMTFTLDTRTRNGFTGSASIRIRLLPIGGGIGSVAMVRR
jgi:hypothetical protein